MKNELGETSIIALGGLREVGKNMYVVTHEDEIIIIDAGVLFPEDDLLGIDYVIQDVTYLKQNEKKIKALLITHGHEDHIGGIPFLLQTVNIPVIYAPKIAADLIQKKLTERNINYNNIEYINEDLNLHFKHFDIEFVPTTHSIPDSFAIAIHTPNGTIFETGDFKFDLTPIGPMADIHKMARLGEEGVKVLISDSTNALSEGYSKSESSVDGTLNDIISRHPGRVIIATFASNMYRIKHIVETCKQYNRKIVVFGRSMENAIELALNNELIKGRDQFIDANQAKSLKRNEVCILCTGTQGEPLSALSRIANGTHKHIKLQQSDIVIFSSSAIPGNALAISKTINKLYLQGVKVYTTNTLSNIHASGHGNKEELKLMLRLIKPKYFMPFHGEFRMLKSHADVAIECGIPKENTFILENGDVLSIRKGRIQRKGHIQAGDAYVDGNRIGEISAAVMRERKNMSNDGIVVVIANIDAKNKQLLGDVNVTTRGFVYVQENYELINKLENMSKKIILNSIKTHVSFNEIKSNIITDLSSFIYEVTGRKPIISPVMMDIKRSA
jgi:ribonuclease J